MENEVEPKQKRKPAKTKVPLTPEEAKTKLLEKLQKAGAKGTPSPYLKTKPLDAPVYEESLTTLAAGPAPEIFIERGSAKPKYFLWRFRPIPLTAETVAPALLARIESAHPRIEPLAKLKSSTPTKERPFVPAALEHLREEGKLIALQFGSAKTVQTLYVAAAKLRAALGQQHQPAVELEHRPDPSHWAPEQVKAAYEAHVRQTGYRAMAIATLARIAGAPLEELKAWLREENQAGRIVLSVGDWSLADEDERRGVIELHGQRFLQVRFL